MQMINYIKCIYFVQPLSSLSEFLIISNMQNKFQWFLICFQFVIEHVGFGDLL